MSNKPYLTSSDLVNTIKLNSSFPIAQVTYSDEDLLKFANHELFLAQVPSVLQFHEDYFSFRETVDLKPNKSRYDIPYRAIGNKIYDVYYIEPIGKHFRKLNRIDSADKAFFQFNNNGYITPAHYFIEANQICLTTEVGNTPQGSLVFVYYLRLNNLVMEDRAATCTGFTKEVTISMATMVAGDIFTVDSQTFIADTDFVIAVNDAATATNLSNAINSRGNDYTSTVTSNVITVHYPYLNTEVSTTNSTAFSIDSLQGIDFDQVPANIVNGILVDFLKMKGGHRTYSIDVKLGKNVVSSTNIKFTSSDVPEDFEIGDYICQQFECIIPQIPSDLHSLLAERTVARILEAQGDLQGLQVANGKISSLEAGQATLVQNRVEGSPRKVFNRNSLLRFGKGVNGNRTKV